MIENNHNAKQSTEQENVTILSDKFDYDMDGLDTFLDKVFHVELAPDENILCFAPTAGKTPSFPSSDEEMLAKLNRVSVKKALYFSTATSGRDELTGKLFNRKNLFKRFFVLVLDDIGTKVPKSKIPKELVPTYIIESSAGNFQYGYVLQEPLDVLEQAEALVQLIYEAGLSDNGGKMATKIVRLPDGVNGKKGEKGDFRVQLRELNDRYWSPAEILDILDLGVTWDQVVKDAGDVAKRRARKSTGATAYRPDRPVSPNLNGIVDPVLEALYENNMVVQELNDWVTIKCPWGDTHTSGGDTAGYSPIGRGEGDYSNRRTFKCFHEHCQSHQIKDFLQYVRSNYNVVASAYVEPEVQRLLSSLVFDPVNKGVWDITKQTPILTPRESAQYVWPYVLSVVKPNGDMEDVKAITLYLNSLEKVIVSGETFDPSTDAVLVEDAGHKYLNKFTRPEWGDGAYAEDEVNYFISYITYLIPDPDEREYFLDWLAAKVQDYRFRGAGILMVAKSQGTGRSTLAQMLFTLLGVSNCEKVPFDVLSSTGNFNDWQTKSLLVTDETYAVGNGDSYYKVYERIKERIDPLPEMIRVKPKYGKERMQMTYSSILMFSNHEDAMAVGHDDRRIYVITNPIVPAAPEFFTDLHRWINRKDQNDNPVWARHIWRWLRQRPVDMNRLLAKAAMTKGKAQMVQSSRSDIERVVIGLLEQWPSPLLTIKTIRELLAPHRIRLTDDPRKMDAVIRKIIEKKTVAVKNGPIKYNGITQSFRCLSNRIPELDFICGDDNLGAADVRKYVEMYDNNEDLKQTVIDLLHEIDL